MFCDDDDESGKNTQKANLNSKYKENLNQQ